MHKSLLILAVIVCLGMLETTTLSAAMLRLVHDPDEGTITAYRPGANVPLVTQNARPDHRPFLHPLQAPDGNGVLTENRPDHHPHQTGLYWGFTRVNNRDFFHHPSGDYWRRVGVEILAGEGEEVRWRTVYDLLGDDGMPMLRETQTWTLKDHDDQYELTVRWDGLAYVPITVGKYDYGGLFLRMPWRNGMAGEVINGARQRNERAEGQRANWVDVGLQLDGRNDFAHIAIFDHGKNPGFPQPWRVDSQFGVGPVRARLGDWSLVQDETITYQHKLIVYTGALNDVKLTEQWEAYSEQGGTWALWNIAQQEGRTAEFLTPERAVASMTVPDGFLVNVFAAEPMMSQPMAFCWDDRGRLWIAENRDYESRGGGFANSGDSQIVILEDTNRDGIADRRQVFLEGIPFPAAVAVGMGGLWLGAPPNLLFVPDRDRDDRADLDDIQIRLTGWGISDRHETLNSFHWGPDGWLYGCQGFATPSQVGKPKGAGRIWRHGESFPEQLEFADQPTDINGGVWRYHPTKDRFEVVAHGFSNPWGIDYNRHGQLVISACVIPHLWHVIPGGIYHRQGGQHFNPHVYRDIRTIADHRHRSAHGGARVYLSDAFPAAYRDRVFMANIHEHAVLTDILEPSGSGYIGRHGDDFLLANNAQWIGFSMEIGPDGGVYVLDWHDADICGKEVLNKETGRIFRIVPEKSHASDWPGRYDDVAQADDKQLARYQSSPSAWHARRARIVLQHRATEREIDPSAVTLLRSQLAARTGASSTFPPSTIPRAQSSANGTSSWHDSSSLRLSALWTLHVIGQLSEADLLSLLDDSDPYVRAWSIQLLNEDQNAKPLTLDRLAKLAVTETSPVVRLYLASALQRIALDHRWPIAEGLVQHGEDASDHNLPWMIWFGIEPLIPLDPDRALTLAAKSQLPDIRQFIARRLTDADELAVVVTGIGRDPALREPFLLGLRAGLEGRVNVEPPKNWAEVYLSLPAEGPLSRLALDLAQQFGDRTATEAMLKTLDNGQADPSFRKQALRALTARRIPELVERLPHLIQDPGLRLEAIRAVAAFEDERLGKALLANYDQFSESDKLEVVQAMSARSTSGRQLTAALKSEQIPRRDVPAYIARQLQRVVGNGFLEVWGPIDTLGDDKEAAFVKYRQLLSGERISQGDLAAGEAVFRRTCAVCHKLHGGGGDIGPELTGANRGNLDYLLTNILTPSVVIQDAYRMTLVVTDEGRVYSGILAGEDERSLLLRVVGQEAPIVIPKSQIESREMAPVSMMPEGLLGTLDDTEVVHLIRYLQNLEAPH